MKPDIDLQLQVVQKALTDIISPAIDPDNQPANEQVQLCLHMLAIVRSRMPFQRRFVRSELKNNLALLGSILECAAGSLPDELAALAQVGEQVTGVLNDIESDTELLIAESARLKTALSVAVRQLSEQPCYKQVEAISLQYASVELEKARAWFIDCGIESQPETLPKLTDL